MARARSTPGGLPTADPTEGFNNKVLTVLKNPTSFPPEFGQWVRSQIVRNPTVKIADYQLPALDKKHQIGTTGEPPFQNSWVNYGGGFDTCYFYKDNEQRVWLGGMIKGGSSGTVVFTLPGGYHPLGGQILFDGQSNSALARVDVLASGDVVVVTGNTAWVSLNGLSFRI